MCDMAQPHAVVPMQTGHSVMHQHGVQLPLALEHASRRKQALHALRDLLNTSAVDYTFLQQALPCLTAQEVVHLVNWHDAGSDPVKSPWYGVLCIIFMPMQTFFWYHCTLLLHMYAHHKFRDV